MQVCTDVGKNRAHVSSSLGARRARPTKRGERETNDEECGQDEEEEEEEQANSRHDARPVYRRRWLGRTGGEKEPRDEKPKKKRDDE